jgi:S-methylmethionine-dependent homocysteine/selenocysteine methylase
LRRYYEPYCAAARRIGVGCLLDTATWRASADWGARLGYSPAALDTINRDSVALLEAVRAAWETPEAPVLINGAIGPRGDGYVPSALMDPDTAAAYHTPQVASFAASAADLITAWTMTNAPEAIGITRAAVAATMPVAIAFTVETDGRLPDGTALGAAIEAVETATAGAPAYYMINCAHPTHFDAVLAAAPGAGNAWMARLRGLRANPSSQSHAELNEATTLDEGDPAQLGQQLRGLRLRHRGLNIMGGCCGSDHRHMEQIGLACRAA